MHVHESPVRTRSLHKEMNTNHD